MNDKDIMMYRVNHRVGQKIKVPKLMSNDKATMVEAVIIGIYPNHCVVQDASEPKYRWSVRWTDLIMSGVQ